MAVIPKEQVAHFQRWQIGSFDTPITPTAPEPPPEPSADGPLTVDLPEEAKTVTEVPVEVPQLPTAEEIEQIREAARQEGYEAGFAEGREAGQQAAEEAARTLVGELQQLHDAFQSALTDMDQTVAESLLELAVEIARQLSRSQIAADPDYLLPLVREAVATLPLHHAHIVVHVHPDDAAKLRPHLESLGGNSAQLIEDLNVSPGGCQVRAGTSEIDASIETRWQRVLEAIGLPAAPWLKRP